VSDAIWRYPLGVQEHLCKQLDCCDHDVVSLHLECLAFHRRTSYSLRRRFSISVLRYLSTTHASLGHARSRTLANPGSRHAHIILARRVVMHQQPTLGPKMKSGSIPAEVARHASARRTLLKLVRTGAGEATRVQDTTQAEQRLF
jgi:hypothetical protein